MSFIRFASDQHYTCDYCGESAVGVNEEGVILCELHMSEYMEAE
jgi:hypothetical protein